MRIQLLSKDAFAPFGLSHKWKNTLSICFTDLLAHRLVSMTLKVRRFCASRKRKANAAASSMSAVNTTCKCFCAMALFSSSCASLPVSSGAVAAPYPQCPGRRLQAGPSGHVFQSNVDLRDSFGVFVPPKWTVMAMICNDFINFVLTLCKVWMISIQTKSVPHQAGQWQMMATNAFPLESV